MESYTISSSASSSSAASNEMPELEQRFYTRLRHHQPKYTQYQTYELRLKTFENWPVGLSQTNTEMASAGFFYSSVGDTVECFHCGVSHKQWLKYEIPKNTHAKISGKRCYYAQLMWGKRLIDSVSIRNLFGNNIFPNTTVFFGG